MEGLRADWQLLSGESALDALAEYTVTVEGKKRKVRLLKISDESTALLELDGDPVKMSFQTLLNHDAQALVNINGKSYKIKLRRNDRPTAFSVEVDGKKFLLQLEHSRKRLSGKGAAARTPTTRVLERGQLRGKKKGAVTSIMPGRVVLLKVKEGDEVKAGDPLCIVEAMKMENEIIAPREGIVKEVRVELGSIVDKSEVLFVIE